MKKKIVLALCAVFIAAGGIGMASLPHEEQPVSQELLAEAMAEEPEEPEEVEEEVEKVRECLEGCTLEPGHDGPCVLKTENVEVVLKTTSMERDLKVKFVDKKSGKVISGEDFRLKLTGPSKKTKEYSDHDKDGIIWVKDIEGGKYTVEMLELDGYVKAKSLTADVKKKIEYKVVEIAEEIKKESEINVSKEDAAYGGTSKDESTSESGKLQDTVEFVESTRKEVGGTEKEQKKDSFGQFVFEKQKKDAFGQMMFQEQKKDEFGTPMYSKIVSEPAKYHTDGNGDGTCDRCGAQMKQPCTHTDKNNDGKCDQCQEAVQGIHVHEDVNPVDCKCDGCGSAMHEEGDNGLCKKCSSVINAENHTVCKDEKEPKDGICDYSGCGKTVPSTEPQPQVEDGNQNGAGEVQPAADESETETRVIGFALRRFGYLRTAPQEVIVYDTNSAPVYDTSSAPVYDENSEPVYVETEKEPEYIYTGWQTIDGATYYFDKNGNKVTGYQVIQGVAYTFNSNGVRTGNIGIDVSKYQTGIDWNRVKNAGINFVMIRCGYRGYGSGVLVEDPMYASHIKGAKAAGLRVGVYFFSQAVNEAEAVEEASMAVALANKYGINMPIAIDSEYANGGAGRADGLSKSARTAITRAFCNTVQSAGHSAMVYASKSWFGSHLDVSQLSGYKIWVAHYADQCGYKGTYHIWQNTSKGKVDGVPGRVDMNISSI